MVNNLTQDNPPRWRASLDACQKHQFRLMMILLFSLTTSFCLFLDRYKHASGDARYLGRDIWVIIIILLAILQSPYYLKSNLSHKENPLFHLLLKQKLAHQGYYSIKSLVFH